MMIPKIEGMIDRRILINYQVDEDVLADLLPAPFTPKLVQGKGIAGICLIRLKALRPRGLPKLLGVSSENGAHRIAVEWRANGRTHQGVYIPRRDTSSKMSSIVGGVLFPGVHHRANFSVHETKDSYEVGFESEDKTSLSIKAAKSTEWNPKSVFKNLDDLSSFFEQGSVGYSPRKNHFEGLQLIVPDWRVSQLKVESVRSSFFEDQKLIPKGTVVFDNALLMENIEHQWIGLKPLYP